jgi:hypothetical protein
MAPAAPTFRWKVVSTPLATLGDAEDSCVVRSSSRRLEAMLVDPLVHGERGRAIRRRALAAVAAAGQNWDALFHQLHRRLAGSGGASVAVLRIDPRARRLWFRGTGRIRGRVIAPVPVVLESGPGIVGVGRPVAPASVEVPWEPGTVTFLAVDGVVEGWDLAPLRFRGASSLDEVALRLVGTRGRLPDDATLLLVGTGRSR